MKSDLSLGDLKKQKSRKITKRFQIDFGFFFYIEAPYETKTSLFYRHSLIETRSWFIFWE